MSFYELHNRLLFAQDDAASSSDAELLYNCLGAVPRLESDDAKLYNSRIVVGMQWCLLVNKAFYQANGRSLPACFLQPSAPAMLGALWSPNHLSMRYSDMSSGASTDSNSTESSRNMRSSVPRKSVTSLSTMSAGTTTNPDDLSNSAAIMSGFSGAIVPHATALDDTFDFNQPMVPQSQLLDPSSMPFSLPDLDGTQPSSAAFDPSSGATEQFDRDFFTHTPGFSTFTVDMLAAPQPPQQTPSTGSMHMLLDTGPRDMYMNTQWGPI